MRANESCHETETGPSFGVRLALFIAVVGLVVGTAAWLLRPRIADMEADLSVRVTMAGFDPAQLAVPAGQRFSVQFINADSEFHPGGAMHQFAAPDLGIDVLIPPRESRVVALPALAPGTYIFYCNVCCGGKDAPTMQGSLEVS